MLAAGSRELPQVDFLSFPPIAGQFMHRQNAHGMALAGRHALNAPPDTPIGPAILQSVYPCGSQSSESAES